MSAQALDLVAYAFWLKVGQPQANGCRLWKGCKPGEYGKFPEGPKGHQRAHRYSYLIHHGPVPDGLLVCHKCDTPACVAPDHLFAGTAGDNAKDRSAKQRHRGGANHPARKRLKFSKIIPEQP
jgi:hypothetical protein